jgi:hypothetical protein
MVRACTACDSQGRTYLRTGQLIYLRTDHLPGLFCSGFWAYCCTVLKTITSRLHPHRRACCDSHVKELKEQVVMATTAEIQLVRGDIKTIKTQLQMDIKRDRANITEIELCSRYLLYR